MTLSLSHILSHTKQFIYFLKLIFYVFNFQHNFQSPKTILKAESMAEIEDVSIIVWLYALEITTTLFVIAFYFTEVLFPSSLLLPS